MYVVQRTQFEVFLTINIALVRKVHLQQLRSISTEISLWTTMRPNDIAVHSIGDNSGDCCFLLLLANLLALFSNRQYKSNTCYYMIQLCYMFSLN